MSRRWGPRAYGNRNRNGNGNGNGNGNMNKNRNAAAANRSGSRNSVSDFKTHDHKDGTLFTLPTAPSARPQAHFEKAYDNSLSLRTQIEQCQVVISQTNATNARTPLIEQLFSVSLGIRSKRSFDYSRQAVQERDHTLKDDRH